MLERADIFITLHYLTQTNGKTSTSVSFKCVPLKFLSKEETDDDFLVTSNRPCIQLGFLMIASSLPLLQVVFAENLLPTGEQSLCWVLGHRTNRLGLVLEEAHSPVKGTHH